MCVFGNGSCHEGSGSQHVVARGGILTGQLAERMAMWPHSANQGGHPAILFGVQHAFGIAIFLSYT